MVHVLEITRDIAMLRLLREAGWQIRLDCIFIYLENIIPLEKCYDIISIVGAAAAIVG